MTPDHVRSAVELALRRIGDLEPNMNAVRRDPVDGDLIEQHAPGFTGRERKGDRLRGTAGGPHPGVHDRFELLPFAVPAAGARDAS